MCWAGAYVDAGVPVLGHSGFWEPPSCLFEITWPHVTAKPHQETSCSPGPPQGDKCLGPQGQKSPAGQAAGGAVLEGALGARGPSVDRPAGSTAPPQLPQSP